MVFIGILSSIVAIGALCWLLFTLAVFALPFFAGVSAGTWAFQTGAGWLGAILVGLAAAALTLGLGQFLLAFIRPLWIRLAIALAFVAPAALAGYHATHGIVKTHHALRHLADHLLRHRRSRRWCHGADSGDSNGRARANRAERRARLTSLPAAAGRWVDVLRVALFVGRVVRNRVDRING